MFIFFLLCTYNDEGREHLKHADFFFPGIGVTSWVPWVTFIWEYACNISYMQDYIGKLISCQYLSLFH
jgi:hypothetical protein